MVQVVQNSVFTCSEYSLCTPSKIVFLVQNSAFVEPNWKFFTMNLLLFCHILAMMELGLKPFNGPYFVFSLGLKTLGYEG